MRLKELLSELNLDSTSVKDRFNFDQRILKSEIRGISCDSKRVSEDFLYVAIKGERFDGHNFIREAVERGAKAVIIQNSKFKIQNSKFPIFIVKDTRESLAELSAKFYGFPSKNLRFIGITGTNGKTTVSYLMESILKRKGLNVGVIGTVNYRIAGKEILPAVNTTPSALELHHLLSEMTKRGIDYVVMEVSSHSLDQKRVYGIDFDYAVYTNLSQDHLDYHKNLKNYFLAKAKLFESLKNTSFAIINSDDRFFPELKGMTKAKIYTYGVLNRCDIRAENIEWNLEGIKFSVKGENLDFTVESKLLGLHNVYNLLAAITTAIAMRIDTEIIREGAKDLRCIPGRLEKINTGGDFKVFIDYAHTPEAVRCVLSTLKTGLLTLKRCQKVRRSRIICVFGCGGERDRKKRPKIAKIISENSDYFIITNDNPRNEDPNRIINDILKGVKTENFEVILDRREAIKKAISMAKDRDIIAILGKGHERYQIIGGRKIPFDDRRSVKECLRPKRSWR